MDIRKTGIAVLTTLSMAGAAVAANDSTSIQEVEVPWQPPSYAATAGTANYATNAGQLGGKGEGQLNVNSASSANLASYVPSTGVTGIPTCAAGYVLMKTAGSFLCVNSVSYANDLSQAPNCSSGQALSRDAQGNYTCVDAGGGGGGGGEVTGACSGSSETGWTSCWGKAGACGYNDSHCGGGGWQSLGKGYCVDSKKVVPSPTGGSTSFSCP